MHNDNNRHHYKYDTLWNICKQHSEMTNEINHQYIALLSLLTHSPNISNEQFINRVAEISSMGDIVVAYYQDDKDTIHLIGSGTIIYEPKIIHGCKKVGHIEDIVVHANHRSNGIARNILEMLVNRSKQKDCYKVILDCKHELMPFYEKNGFHHTSNQMSMYLS